MIDIINAVGNNNSKYQTLFERTPKMTPALLCHTMNI